MISDKTLTIQIPGELSYDTDYGLFFIYNSVTKRPSNIKKCRELFGKNFQQKSKFIGFAVTDINSIKRINTFWNKREEKLGIAEENRSVFYKASLPNGKELKNIVIVKLNNVWLKDFVARAITTLLFRIAATHYENNFDNAINQDEWAGLCKPAILFWLDGNTKPTFKKFKNLYYNGEENPNNHDNTGFVYHFEDCSPEDLKKLLVKP